MWFRHLFGFGQHATSQFPVFSLEMCTKDSECCQISHHHHHLHLDQVAGEERGYRPGGGRIKDPRGPLGLFATTLRLLSYLVLIHCIVFNYDFEWGFKLPSGRGGVRLLWEQNQTQEGSAELQHRLQQPGQDSNMTVGRTFKDMKYKWIKKVISRAGHIQELFQSCISTSEFLKIFFQGRPYPGAFSKRPLSRGSLRRKPPPFGINKSVAYFWFFSLIIKYTLH